MFNIEPCPAIFVYTRAMGHRVGWSIALIIQVFISVTLNKKIVRRSPPRHSPPQTFTTSDVHHPLCKIRRSPPQTFTTSDVHHLRRSPPQTFTTPDVHHPQCKIRRSPPQTFTTPDVHHLRHSPPQTFTTPYSKMRHSPRLFGLQEHFECLDGW